MHIREGHQLLACDARDRYHCSCTVDETAQTRDQVCDMNGAEAFQRYIAAEKDKLAEVVERARIQGE